MTWETIDRYMKLLDKRMRKGKITPKQFKRYCTQLYFWGLQIEENKYAVTVEDIFRDLEEEEEL